MPKNSLTEGEQRKFDSYLKLTEIHTMRWNERRKVDIRFSYALWALLVSSAVTVQKLDTPCVLFAVLAAIVVVQFWFVTAAIWQSNNQDITNAFYFHREAERVWNGELGPKERMEDKPPRTGVFKDWWALSQLIITSLLAGATYYAIQHMELSSILLDKRGG